MKKKAIFLQLGSGNIFTLPLKYESIEKRSLFYYIACAVNVKLSKEKMTTVEASMRLDAIASAGFGMSRNKMASAISSNDVRVNWKEITQASHNVKAGLIAVRGKGKLEVEKVSITMKTTLSC